jgi:hypothetical protein
MSFAGDSLLAVAPFTCQEKNYLFAFSYTGTLSSLLLIVIFHALVSFKE